MIFALAILFVLLNILAFASMKPAVFRVQRSMSIKAPPERIFALLNDFHAWPNWAPQDKMDSSMTRTFGPLPSGLGAVSEWVSTGSAGRGRMEVTESQGPVYLVVTVDFVKPFKAHNINKFSLEPAGEMTQVTWAMQGTTPFIVKVMSIFVSMDRMIGKHFEAGLASLKDQSES